MKTSKYLLITLIIIEFTAISCAKIPRCEGVASHSDNNMLLLGIYHSLIIPFSVLGKLLGVNIGLYELNGNFSYWIGYLIGIAAYARLLVFIGQGINCYKMK